MIFDKKEPEKKQPTLLGEDFDIFPDLGDRPIKSAEPDAPEIVQEEEDDVEPTPFQKRVAAISDENWTKIQIAGGSVLGLLAGLSISFFSAIPGFSNWSLIAGIVIALIVPGTLEKQADRTIKKLRLALIISLSIVLAFYALYGFVINPNYFSANA